MTEQTTPAGAYPLFRHDPDLRCPETVRREVSRALWWSCNTWAGWVPYCTDDDPRRRDMVIRAMCFAKIEEALGLYALEWTTPDELRGRLGPDA
jgi:hypothetical protein